MIPASIVAADPRHLCANNAEDSDMTIPQLVLCGDPNQLGPLICDDDARANGLDISLLERLFKRALYQPKHRPTMSSIIAAYPNSPTFPSGESEYTPDTAKRFTNLVKVWPFLYARQNAHSYAFCRITVAIPSS